MRCLPTRKITAIPKLYATGVILSAWHQTPSTARLEEADLLRLRSVGHPKASEEKLIQRNRNDKKYMHLPASMSNSQLNDLMKHSKYQYDGSLVVSRPTEQAKVVIDRSKALALGFCALLAKPSAPGCHARALGYRDGLLRFCDAIDQIFKLLEQDRKRLRISSNGIRNFKSFLLGIFNARRARNVPRPDKSIEGSKLYKKLMKWQLISDRQGMTASERTPWPPLAAVASLAEREAISKKLQDLAAGKLDGKTIAAQNEKKVVKITRKQRRENDQSDEQASVTEQLSFLDQIRLESGLRDPATPTLPPTHMAEYRALKALIDAVSPLADTLKWMRSLQNRFGEVSANNKAGVSSLDRISQIIDKQFGNNWDVIKACVLDPMGRAGSVFENVLTHNSTHYVQDLTLGLLCKSVSENLWQNLIELSERLTEVPKAYRKVSDIPTVSREEDVTNVELTPQGRYIGHIFLNAVVSVVKKDTGLNIILRAEECDQLQSQVKSYEWLRNYKLAGKLARTFTPKAHVYYTAERMHMGDFDMRRLCTPVDPIPDEKIEQWKPFDAHYTIKLGPDRLPYGDLPYQVPDIANSILKTMLELKRTQPPLPESKNVSENQIDIDDNELEAITNASVEEDDDYDDDENND